MAFSLGQQLRGWCRRAGIFTRHAGRRRGRLLLEHLETRTVPALSFAGASVIGSAGTEDIESMVADANGNLYLVGSFSGTTDFDPGSGVNSVTSNGTDMFIAKISAGGSLAWVRTYGGSSGDAASAVAVDGSGNVYVTGGFFGQVNFGGTNLGAAGNGNYFVMKMDAGGNIVWIRGEEGSGGPGGREIAVDDAGSVYVAGTFFGTVDFQPGSGTSSLTATTQANGNCFVVKFDNSGNFIYVSGFLGDSSSYCVPESLVVNAAHEVYVSGYFHSTIDFDPGSATKNLTADGGTDGFLSKLDSSGSYLFGGKLGGNSTAGDHCISLALDGAGNLYMVGDISGNTSSDIDPGSGVLTDSGGSYLLRFDSSCNLQGNWVLGYHGHSVAIDGSGNLYVTGEASGFGDQDFDPGAGQFLFNPSSRTHVYVVRLDPSVGFIDATFFGNSANNDIAGDTAVTPGGDVTVYGNFSGTADFDPGTATYSLTTAGNQDIYMLKLVTSSASAGVTVTPTGGSLDVAEGGVSDSYTVVLDSAPSGNVTVNFNGGSQLNLSSSSLVFTASDWFRAQTVTVRAVDDSTLENDHTGVIVQSISTSDSRYRDVTLASLTVNITDNDMGGVTITPSGSSTDVTEGGASDSYTVVLTKAPTGNVTIAVDAGSQLSVRPASLVFTRDNWSVAQTVTVQAVDNLSFDGARVAVVSHRVTSSDVSYKTIDIPSVSVNVNDNDVPTMFFKHSELSLGVVEGKSRPVSAVLNAAPSQDVTVILSQDPDLTVSPTSLVFTPDDWNSPHWVSIAAADNDQDDGNLSRTLDGSIDTSDPLFAGASVTPADVTIADDDGAIIVNGTEGADQISVLCSSLHIQVIVNRKSTFYPSTATRVLISGFNGDDVIQVANPTIPIVVLAAGGADKLQVDGQLTANTFAVDNGSVTVNGMDVTFSEVETVVLSGKSRADTFTIPQAPGYALTVIGAGGQDRLIGPDQANTWQITGPSGGTLDGTIAFLLVEDLTGGSDDDTFVFGAAKAVGGRIDGGGGNNTLDFSAYKTALSANLQTSLITGTKGFANIASILGGAAVDKIVGANTSNVWNITAANVGTVNGIAFSSFEALTGGTSDDTFVFADNASLKGKIDGGGGSDVLDFSGYLGSLTINLQLKTATATGGWLNLEQFVGGQGASTLIAPNKINNWSLTSSGSGSLTGGFGFQNFQNLVGGTLADRFDLGAAGDWSGLLDGGTGADTLVAGVNGVYVLGGINMGTLNGRNFRSVETRL